MTRLSFAVHQNRKTSYVLVKIFSRLCVDARMGNQQDPELGQRLVIFARSAILRELTNLRTNDLHGLGYGRFFKHRPCELDVLTVIKRLAIKRAFCVNHALDYPAAI